MTRKIAFYLPQYHPVPENDAFWGKGFTEWTNVTKAKPLFKGHCQPFLPSDLGFYDLRLEEIRHCQAHLAREAGIEGFCYWHYWFGRGKRVLDRVFREVLLSGEPDFPFCLAWANQSWTGKWHGLDDQIIFDQTYPGIDDIICHFHELLPAFKDHRYITVEGKPLFLVYQPNDAPNTFPLIHLWQELARKEGLEGIFFVGNNTECRPDSELAFQLDGRAENGIKEAQCYATSSPADTFSGKLRRRFLRSYKHIVGASKPIVYDYKQYVRSYISRSSIDQDLYPTIIPGWDNTPRSKERGIVFVNESPALFCELLNHLQTTLRSRPEQRQIIFLKSWNEWAEGNVLEPSRRWGSQYLDSIRTI